MDKNTPSNQRAETEAVRERIWARARAWEVQLLIERVKERTNGHA